jgi:hypothetical protein
VLLNSVSIIWVAATGQQKHKKAGSVYWLITKNESKNKQGTVAFGHGESNPGLPATCWGEIINQESWRCSVHYVRLLFPVRKTCSEVTTRWLDSESERTQKDRFSELEVRVT